MKVKDDMFENVSDNTFWSWMGSWALSGIQSGLDALVAVLWGPSHAWETPRGSSFSPRPLLVHGMPTCPHVTYWQIPLIILQLASRFCCQLQGELRVRTFHLALFPQLRTVTSWTGSDPDDICRHAAKCTSITILPQSSNATYGLLYKISLSWHLCSVFALEIRDFLPEQMRGRK